MNNPATCVDKPVIDLEDCKTSLLAEVFLLLFRRVWMSQVLEKPGSEDICCLFREDATLLRLRLLVIFVFFFDSFR